MITGFEIGALLFVFLVGVVAAVYLLERAETKRQKRLNQDPYKIEPIQGGKYVLIELHQDNGYYYIHPMDMEYKTLKEAQKDRKHLLSKPKSD